MNGKLYKSNRDKMILGVCGGLGQYLGIDPSIIRILWVIAAFIYGSGIFLYFIVGIILPEEDTIEGGIPYKAQQETSTEQQDHSKTIGILLVCLGAFFILRKFIGILDFQYLFPIVFIILGIFMIGKGRGKDHEE